MTAEIKQGNDLVQNVFVCLADCIKDASMGGDYSANWEKAAQYQTELLRFLNDLKYRQVVKPRGAKFAHDLGNNDER